MGYRLSKLIPFAIVIAMATAARAQQTAEPRLSDQDPFDRITLDEENQGAVIKVEPLDLPGRRMPEMPFGEDRIRVKLYSQLDKTYEIAWKHITKIEFYEQMLLAEARRFIDQNRLDDAFDALQHLRQNYPQTPGLAEQLEAYLYISAGRLFREERWSEALGVLEELHRLNPDYKLGATGRPLAQVLASVIEKMVDGYLANSDHRTARLLLARVRRDYGERFRDTVDRREQELQSLAIVQRDAAAKHATQQKWREAHRAARNMLDIWPDVAGGAQLAAEIRARYPMMTVGVTQSARNRDRQRIDDWAARRAGKLTTRPLIEYLKPGAEGGQYAFRDGSLQVSEDRRRMTLQLAANNAKATGYDLAQRLFDVAQPDHADYNVTWASLFRSATVRDVMTVEVELRRSYVAPEAVLEFPGLAALSAGKPGLFRAVASPGDEQPYEVVLRFGDAAAPAEIVERRFDESAVMLSALRRGEVDVVDRVFPADVRTLENDSAVRVGRYVLPTLHYLVPSPQSELAKNATIRRAIAYGIPRDAILRDQLLGGRPMAGCRTINGPFSPGAFDLDPLSYAVDPQVPNRPADPRLAATLIGLVERQLKSEAEKQMQSPPALAIVIGHSQSEVAKVACQSIAQQLTALGLATTLQPLPAGETRDVSGQCDFVYTEVTIGEPMIDARRLFGEAGAAATSDPYLKLALRRLDEATTWPQARARLRELHRIVHAEVSVIPLWQIVEHFAYRADVAGLDEQTVHLYDGVERWRRSPADVTVQARATE